MSSHEHPRSWPARYKSHQIEVLETADLHLWIASVEIRKVLPSVRSDAQLLKAYGGRFKKLDKGPRIFFSEAALRSELQRMGGRDALMMLAWLEKALFYPAARKREDLPALERMYTKPRTPNDPAPQEDDHIAQPPPLHTIRPQRKPNALDQPQEPDRLRGGVGAPFRRIWRGEHELLLTLVGGGAAVFGWLMVVSALLRKISSSESYTGAYVSRQWLALLLLLSLCVAVVWWCVGVMRCALRRQREGRSFIASMLVFVGSMMMLPSLLSVPVLMAAEWVHGWWFTVRDENKAAQVLHIPAMGRIVVRGELGFGSYQQLQQAMQMKPKLHLVQIESPGGFVVEGLAMARLIEQNHMDTVSLEDCASACTFLFAAGSERYLGPKTKLGFHRSWAYGLPFSSTWSRTDHEIADYYRSRSTAEDFVKTALDTPGYRMWYPPHGRMFEAGYATKRWDERKPGY